MITIKLDADFTQEELEVLISEIKIISRDVFKKPLEENNGAQLVMIDDTKEHYESLLDCCNKLLDKLDAGEHPNRYVIGLRILLNRPIKN